MHRKRCIADWIIAGKLLELFKPEQIEYGILLAPARRLCSRIAGKVLGMQYFQEALLEPEVFKEYSESYTDYLRSVIARHRKPMESVRQAI